MPPTPVARKMILKTSNPRCQSLTKSGKPRRAAATECGLCFFHANPTRLWNWAGLGGRRMVIFKSDWICRPAWITQWLSETPSPD